MRPRAKGSALYYGSAFDAASDILIKDKDLIKAKERFTDLWMVHEQNLNCKFSKTDLDVRLFESSDLSKLHAAAANLNHSKAKGAFDTHGDVIVLLKEIKKMKEMSFTRDLTLEEERFLHYATVLSMLRKGYLMLESFNINISPHITGVIGTQVKTEVHNGLGDEITGYIDLLCNMSEYKLPNGRVLSADDLVVADVKTASITYWNKLDDLNNSDQLDSYLVSPQVQSIQATNLICYMAISKQVSADEKYFCQSCGNEKTSSHKKCNAEVDSKRCNGDWQGSVKYFCEAKIVIGERNVQEAAKMYEDYDGVTRGIKAEVYVRNRDQCQAFGSYCEYLSVCGQCFSSQDQEDKVIEDWIKDFGE